MVVKLGPTKALCRKFLSVGKDNKKITINRPQWHIMVGNSKLVKKYFYIYGVLNEFFKKKRFDFFAKKLYSLRQLYLRVGHIALVDVIEFSKKRTIWEKRFEGEVYQCPDLPNLYFLMNLQH
jgi:hypothetical protein